MRRHFIKEVTEVLQDSASRRDLQLLLTKDETWKVLVAETELPRLSPQDPPGCPQFYSDPTSLCSSTEFPLGKYLVVMAQTLSEAIFIMFQSLICILT